MLFTNNYQNKGAKSLGADILHSVFLPKKFSVELKQPNRKNMSCTSSEKAVGCTQTHPQHGKTMIWAGICCKEVYIQDKLTQVLLPEQIGKLTYLSNTVQFLIIRFCCSTACIFSCSGQ